MPRLSSLALTGVLMLAVAFGTLSLPAVVDAKGGGFKGGGGFKSSGSIKTSAPKASASAPKPAAVAPKAAPTPKPAPAPKVSTKPSGTTAKAVAAAPVTANGKKYSSTGNVVGGTYQPRFRGGYSAPAGSVVYYPDNSWMMWIPLMYLMNNDSHRDAVVQEKDPTTGETIKETVVQEEGLDTMYVINWIITILLAVGLIAGLVWLVNKFTSNRSRKYV